MHPLNESRLKSVPLGAVSVNLFNFVEQFLFHGVAVQTIKLTAER